MTFRYYDPIIQIVQANVTHDRRQFYLLKNEFSKAQNNKDDTASKMLQKLGIDDKNAAKKIVFKHKKINNHSVAVINHMTSKNTMTI